MRSRRSHLLIEPHVMHDINDEEYWRMPQWSQLFQLEKDFALAVEKQRRADEAKRGKQLLNGSTRLSRNEFEALKDQYGTEDIDEMHKIFRTWRGNDQSSRPATRPATPPPEPATPPRRSVLLRGFRRILAKMRRLYAKVVRALEAFFDPQKENMPPWVPPPAASASTSTWAQHARDEVEPLLSQRDFLDSSQTFGEVSVTVVTYGSM